MNVTSTLECTAQRASVAGPSPEDSSGHAELLSIWERLAKIWTERLRTESELWNSFKMELARASDVTEALQAHSESSGQRIRLSLENARRIFEEQQDIAARLSRPKDSGTPVLRMAEE